MADPGAYLTAFNEGFIRSRGFQEASNRAAAGEAADVFKIQRYLDELDRERGNESTLADIYRRGSAPTAPPLVPPPVAIPTAQPTPPEFGGAQNFMPLPMPQAPSLSAGGAAAIRQPRPPVAESVFAGITPEARARLMTTPTGLAAYKSLETAERERRSEEDKTLSDEFMTKAIDAGKNNQPGEYYDNLAAMFRHRDNPERAVQMMEFAKKARTDQNELDNAPKEFAAINEAIRAHLLEQTPASLANVHRTILDSKTVTAKQFGITLAENAIRKALDADNDVNALLTHATLRMLGPNRVPSEQAWSEAMDKYPLGVAKLLQQYIMNPEKTMLPQEMLDILKLQPMMPTKGFTIQHQQAWVATMAEAKAKGIPANSPQFGVMLINKINEMDAAAAKLLHAARQTPEEAAIITDRAAIYKIKRKTLENPEKALASKTSEQLTLLIQRTQADVNNADRSPEERETDKEYLTILRQYRNAKGGGDEQKKTRPMPPASQYKNREIEDPDTGEVKRSDGIRWFTISPPKAK